MMNRTRGLRLHYACSAVPQEPPPSSPCAKSSLQVQWLYHPEESLSGREAFHGAKEVFMSKDHFDEISVRCVEAVVRVHTLEDYERLPRIEKDDYFWRFHYLAVTGTFEPKRVPVYCICAEAYNPDLSMVECDICRDWFHTTCVNLSEDEVESLQSFVCDGCSKDLGKIAADEEQSPASTKKRESEGKQGKGGTKGGGNRYPLDY